MSQHEYGHQGLFINPRFVTSISAVSSSPMTGKSTFVVYIQGEGDGTKLFYESASEAEDAREQLIAAALR
ncbi:hypothetical protein [Xanthomonas sp. NCPPB 1062]|uniref:hypothetical protein n=1 Tax=Xanthomonas sp. NCPPB 1062 TaxID=487523 RepID=UPI003556F0C9